MNFMLGGQPERWLVVHGPPGVNAARLLERQNVRLTNSDILIIEERDGCTETWLEQYTEALKS